MHEYSIVQSLMLQCEENAKANNATKITKVVVKIGVLSGVEVDLLKTAFETFKEGSIAEDAEFVVHIQPILVRCRECGEKVSLRGLSISVLNAKAVILRCLMERICI